MAWIVCNGFQVNGTTQPTARPIRGWGVDTTHQEEDTDEQDRDERRLDVFGFCDRSQLNHLITFLGELYHLAKAIDNKKEEKKGKVL